jgi:translation initiation factor 2B subunit (eIF-2B alpha/beta/delta family)
MFPPEVSDELTRIENDRVSGATALALRAIALLRRVCGEPGLLRQTARAVGQLQPAMAGFRTAAAVAVASDDPRRALEALEEQVRRAPLAIARFAVPLLRLRPPRREPLRIVTCSRSSAVEHTLLALHHEEPVLVCCSESRPAREGITLARVLSDAGLDVVLYSDAGISAAVPGADALVVGADAVAANVFINKVGTAALCALARSCGVPAMLLTGREKLVPRHIVDTLRLPAGVPAELGPEIRGVTVANPYFEAISTDLIDQIVTDRAVVAPGEVSKLSLLSPAVLSVYDSI